MEIRTATLDDIEQICQLYNEFFAYNAKLQLEYCKEANRFYEKNDFVPESHTMRCVV